MISASDNSDDHNWNEFALWLLTSLNIVLTTIKTI